MTLNGTIVSFDKGDRLKRYFFWTSGGKAYCTIQSEFSDKHTGKVIQKITFDGELTEGIFGGSADGAVKAVVSAYLEYFEDYLEGQNTGSSE